MSDSLVHLLSQIITLAGIVSGIVVTTRGFNAVKAANEHDNRETKFEVMKAISERTVPLEEYKPKIRELHAELNATRERVIALEAEARALRAEIERLRSPS